MCDKTHTGASDSTPHPTLSPEGRGGQDDVIARRDFLSGLGTAGALALAGAPWAARAQAPGRTYRIAVFHVALPVATMTEDGHPNFRAFFQEMRGLGFVEGRNLIVQRYSGEGRSDRYAPIAREIVNTRPDLIFPAQTSSARLLRDLTTSIPIVVPNVSDPVAQGLVSNIARPGGNITGFTGETGTEMPALRLQQFHEILPNAVRFGYLTTAASLAGLEAATSALRRAALSLGIELVIHAMDGNFDEARYRAAFAEFSTRGVGGISVSTVGENAANAALIARLALEARIPIMTPSREYADAGALVSYGASVPDNYRKSAGYVARILNGAKPGDLPFQQPTKYEMILNMKTAKALGIEVPFLTLARADEVID